MTNDARDDGVCGNDAGTAEESNLIMANHENTLPPLPPQNNFFSSF